MYIALPRRAAPLAARTQARAAEPPAGAVGRRLWRRASVPRPGRAAWTRLSRGSVRPPSTGSTAPVTYEPAVLARNRATPAMSLGRPARCIGMCLTISSSAPGWKAKAVILLGNSPGAMALTVMSGARSAARWRVIWCTAAFDAG